MKDSACLLSACWRRELPNAGETDLEMMYIHLSNGRLHVVVGDCDKYSKEEMFRVVRRVAKVGPSLFRSLQRPLA